ncbi:alpha-enolase-like isoform 3-T6 [Sarcophilus harrisii]
MSIIKIIAREILDSRGNPTVEVDLHTHKGIFRASVPSGASVGTHEALELRDNDETYFLGKGVQKAIENINQIIAPALIQKKLTVLEQGKIDRLMLELDGTENKSKLGANAILGISLAACKAGAAERCVPLSRHIADLACKEEVILPVPAFNVINGGSHAGNKLAVQEFMILPTGAENFKEAMRIGTEIYHNLKDVIKEKYGQDAINVGDEGGFAPNIEENKEALDLLKDAIAKAGHTDQVVIGIDVAASQFYKDGKYDLDFKSPEDDPGRYITAEDLGNQYKSLINEYPGAGWPSLMGGESWFPIVLETLKIPSLRTYQQVSALGRLKLAPLADLSVWPSIISFSESKNSWATELNLLVRTTENLLQFAQRINLPQSPP